MKKTLYTYGFYLFLYSVGGFFLERIINIIFLGYHFDNSFLYGPYQPLYGSGVLLTLLVYDFYIKKKIETKHIQVTLLIVVAILITALVETITGEFLEALTGVVYWDYGDAFVCSYPYSCLLPTTIFGLISALVILFVHPYVEKLRLMIKDYWILILLIIFFVDALVRTISYL